MTHAEMQNELFKFYSMRHEHLGSKYKKNALVDDFLKEEVDDVFSDDGLYEQENSDEEIDDYDLYSLNRSEVYDGNEAIVIPPPVEPELFDLWSPFSESNNILLPSGEWGRRNSIHPPVQAPTGSPVFTSKSLLKESASDKGENTSMKDSGKKKNKKEKIDNFPEWYPEYDDHDLEDYTYGFSKIHYTLQQNQNSSPSQNGNHTPSYNLLSNPSLHSPLSSYIIPNTSNSTQFPGKMPGDEQSPSIPCSRTYPTPHRNINGNRDTVKLVPDDFKLLLFKIPPMTHFANGFAPHVGPKPKEDGYALL
jgi:hypothetical protein